jgi:hypothetical protein
MKRPLYVRSASPPAFGARLLFYLGVLLLGEMKLIYTMPGLKMCYNV